MPFFTDIFGKEVLISKDGKVHPTSELDAADYVGFYFSAHWCPPCQGFTPVLVKAYIRLQEELKAKGEKFEVVYLSADRTEDQFRHYFDTMPWLALPFGHKTIAELSNKYTVRGIPTLILLHKDGKVFNVDGRGTVTSDPEGSSWLVKK